ncbi:MAG TPA: hypothetical protein VJ719_07710 [Chthoniobacterales bacterium]|nr:hypothetical protein [Chthoniobacterales bacterium]
MKKGNTRLLQLISAASLLAGTVKLATADPFVFDPDGLGPTVRATSISAFHLGSGDTLARAVLPFTVGNTFQLLFHAQQTFVVSSTTGLTTFPFEISILGSVTERITTANDGPPMRFTYQLSKNQSSNSFVEIYTDPNSTADNGLGTGFNDGVLILRGSLVSGLPNVGTFSLADPQFTPPLSLDQFEGNQLGGIASVEGVGATKLNVVVGYVDRQYFPLTDATGGGRAVQIGDIVTLDISHATPFHGVDPSIAFTDSPNPGTGALPSPTVAPNLGAVNGTSGPDFETETTITFSIAPPAPTPTPSPGTTPIPGIPKIVMSTSRTQMREGGEAVITFTVNQPHPDLSVRYSVGGRATLNVDYTLTDINGNPIIPGTVTIPSSQNSVSIKLRSITDNIRESQGEPAKLTLLAGTGYQVPTMVTANRVVVLILDRK